MKKGIFITVTTLLILGVIGAIIYAVLHGSRSESADAQENTSVEMLIANDEQYMDTIDGKNVFFESRIVLEKPFNESDKFVAEEVTNVFQNTLEDGKGGFETTVYFFTHELNDCGTIVEIHKSAFVLDDKAISLDSISVSFDDAFTKARQSNYAPSKSRYITLRHQVGTKYCNPFYTIGNEEYGHLWVDAVTGDVTDKSPSGK